MTRHKSFKRLVRARMQKTGESYTAARASLLTAAEPAPAEEPVLATSDDAIRQRTGRGWEHARLAGAERADRIKASWRERLTTLKSQLEGASRS